MQNPKPRNRPLADHLPTHQMGNMVNPAPVYYIKMVPQRFVQILVGLNLAYYVGMIVYGWLRYGIFDGPDDGHVLIDAGMKVNQLVAQGEIWRLFTAMFIHIGLRPIPMHLLVNLYALIAIGPMVEGYFGHWRFLAIYLLGGLLGSIASYAFAIPNSAGASGAIFAMVGAIIVYFTKYRNNFGQRGRSILQNMLVVAGLNLVFGLSVEGIDNWGHLGGLIGGMIVAWGLIPKYRQPQLLQPGPQPLLEVDQSTQHGLWVVLMIALLWGALQFANQVTVY